MIVERTGSRYDLLVGTALNAAMGTVAAAVNLPGHLARFVVTHRRPVLYTLAALAIAVVAVLGSIHPQHDHTVPRTTPVPTADFSSSHDAAPVHSLVPAVTADEDPAACAVSGNLQCGVGTPDGPVLHPAEGGDLTYSCPDGAAPFQNELGRIVCGYGKEA